MSYIDFWTLCIPHMDVQSISHFAVTSKTYYHMFKYNKELWLQVISLTMKIPTYINNNNTNLLHYYVDFKYLTDEMNNYLHNIDSYKIDKQLAYIYDQILPLITSKKDNIIDYISSIGGINDIINKLIKTKLLGLLSTILYLDGVDVNANMIFDIMRKCNQYKVDSLQFLCQDMNRLYIITKSDILIDISDIHEVLIELLSLPYSIFIHILHSIDANTISYFFIRDFIYNAIKGNTEKISDPLAKMAYTCIYINRYTQIIRDILKFSTKIKTTPNIDAFFYYLFNLKPPNIINKKTYKLITDLQSNKCTNTLQLINSLSI